MSSVAELTAVWEAASRPALAFPSGLTAAALAALRARFEAASPRASWRPSRHRCRTADLAPPGVLDALRALAASITGRGLRLEAMRARCYGPGDYALLADDDQPPGVELCLDFSAHARAPSGPAYCAGRRPYFAMPQQPGTAALILRAPDTRRFMPYLKRFADGAPPEVYLLTLALG